MEIINTSYVLARELLARDDGFITVTVNGNEYTVKSIKRVFTHANVDDSVPYWTLNVEEKKGNLMR